MRNQHSALKRFGLFVLLASTGSLNAQHRAVENIAGDGTEIFASGNLATDTGFGVPSAMSQDTDGNLYFMVSSIADPAVSGIYKIDAVTKELSKVYEDVPGISGLTIDNDGNIYFSRGNSPFATLESQEYIYKINASDGSLDTLAGNGADGFPVDGAHARETFIGNAGGLKIDPTGEFLYYSATFTKNYVQRINLTTFKTERVVGVGSIVDPGDVADGSNALTSEVLVGVGFAWDSQNNFYFGTRDHRIKKVKAADQTIWNVAGTGVGGYNGDDIDANTAEIKISSSGFLITNSDEMILCDTDNHRMRKITLHPGTDEAEIITTFCGTGFSEDAGENPGGNLLNGVFKPVLEVNVEPGDILISNGDLIFSDLGSNHIRRIVVCENPEITSVAIDKEVICKGDSVTLSFEGMLNGANKWDWYKDACPNDVSLGNNTSLKVLVEENASYYILGSGGCSNDVSCTQIDVELQCKEYFNTFTPNGDGKNDFFEIPALANYPENTVQIFNRWGGLLREVQNYDNEQSFWDGTTAGGNAVDSGTYFFTAVANGQTITSGWVEVIK